jgi:predicted O-methyltransferase YrrM
VSATDEKLRGLLDEVYAFGRRNDAEKTARAERMLNITPETGAFLRMLVVAGRLQRVLELGTSNGYSTLWLADACRRTGGRLVTLELSPAKHGEIVATICRRSVTGRPTVVDSWPRCLWPRRYGNAK